MRRDLGKCVVAVLVGSVLTSCSLAHKYIPDSVLIVKAASVQPASSQEIFNISIVNGGKQPLTYWSGGPGRYPGAIGFKATMTDSNGKVTNITDAFPSRSLPGGGFVALGNGQFESGSGIDHDIAAGKSLDVPIAVSPLPPGVYKFEFSEQIGQKGSTSMKVLKSVAPTFVEVRQSAALTDVRNEELYQKERRGDGFASYLIDSTNDPNVLTRIAHDLVDPDPMVAFRAYDELRFSTTLPGNVGHVVASEIDDFPKLPAGCRRPEFILDIASACGDDECLDAVKRSIDSQQSDVYGARDFGVSTLGAFTQPRVTQMLRSFLSDKDWLVQGSAAAALVKRGDPAGVPVLVDIIRHHDSYPVDYLAALPSLPGDPRVKPALLYARSHLKDEVGLDYAKRALDKLIPPTTGNRSTLRVLR